MADVNLNLPEDLQQFVDGQVEAGDFDGASAYIETLIARAQKGKEKLEALLIEGLDSGAPIPLDADEWGRIRGEVSHRNGDIPRLGSGGCGIKNQGGPAGCYRLDGDGCREVIRLSGLASEENNPFKEGPCENPLGFHRTTRSGYPQF